MYPLDEGLLGPTVRITHLREELAAMVRLDVIAGYRQARRAQALGYAFSGRLRGIEGIYVEAASSLPAETDVAFLAMARMLGIPVLTYFRDAYQLFPEDYPTDSLKRRLSRRAFRPAVQALAGSRRRSPPLLGDWPRSSSVTAQTWSFSRPGHRCRLICRPMLERAASCSSAQLEAPVRARRRSSRRLGSRGPPARAST